MTSPRRLTASYAQARQEFLAAADATGAGLADAGAALAATT